MELCAGEIDHITEESESLISAKDPCYVQMGSPLVMKDVTGGGLTAASCQWCLHGVFAHGLECGSEEGSISSPGAFVDVCKFQEWIEETIEKEDGNCINHCAYCFALLALSVSVMSIIINII